MDPIFNHVLGNYHWLGIYLTGHYHPSITIGFVYIVRGGKDRKIYADKLVTEEVYKICRNPMYLGSSYFNEVLWRLV